jgi:hypothetical protein
MYRDGSTLFTSNLLTSARHHVHRRLWIVVVVLNGSEEEWKGWGGEWVVGEEEQEECELGVRRWRRWRWR